ncbi:hemolysin family protein [Nitratireductor basaltis]|uniref:Transporter-associated region n=1 Tax=Nitratireductor basaltis TaxID=472175 RepID=A0A084UEB3_9HYPH|nr:hemolysin family protein [Nitratireductor basaltis]KFB11299.1 Transporter-associated region [Nitratireductor basaltis]
MTDTSISALGAVPESEQATPSPDSEEGPSSSAQRQPSRPGLWQALGSFFGLRNNSTIREDLADALDEHTADTTAFSPGERAMLQNILRLRELRVDDVMVPRADIKAVELNTTLRDLLLHIEESGHSRLPVYGETLDDPRGMVHIRDVVGHLIRTSRHRKGRGRNAKTAASQLLDLGHVDLDRTISELNLVRSLLFVPPSMLASDLMARMQAGRIQMALVIDEYGGTDGLVSLEDIVEMVIGDIEDEHDDDEPMIEQKGDGIFLVDAKAEIDDVAKAIGDGFNAGEHAEEVDTIGGMIFNALGRVPARGEVVQAIPGFEFHVVDADPRRVKRVRIVQGRAAERRRRNKVRAGET